MVNVNWTKKIKAVGFDVDGTLYSYSPEVSIALSQEVAKVAASELGRNVDEFVAEYLTRREKFKGNTLTLNSMGLDGEKIYQNILDHFPLEKHHKVDKRLVSVITELKQKYKLFIITNGTSRQVERKLKVLGLDYHDFDPRIYCYDQGWIKPEPSPFLAAIESLTMKPEEIVYVGDREDVDIEGAQAVGMKTIYVGGPSASSGFTSLADASIESVYDIVSIL